MRPRLLLVPHITELEWVISPELEEWAEVATFDLPGVGDEPPVEPLDRQAIIDRALLEVDRRGWDSYILVCGCLGWTDEGFEDALAAFPHARAVSVPEAPCVSGEFARALRVFCGEVVATAGAPTGTETEARAGPDR